MRRSPAVALFVVLLVLPVALIAQQVTQNATAPMRDPQASILLQNAFRAMGGAVPVDSTATGSVTLVEGSTTSDGTIQILTRGTSQTAETITLSGTQRAVIYSNGNAKEVGPEESVSPSLQEVVTDQCPDFPLPFLASLINNPDESFRYVAQETLNGATAQHIQVLNTFASKPKLQRISPFSTMDIWLDSASGLPLKVAYSRRAGNRAITSISVEILFSKYANVGGIPYPFQIEKSFDGTPWQTITIQNVSFNSGLTDLQFPVQ